MQKLIIGAGYQTGTGKDTACRAIVRRLAGAVPNVHLKFSEGIKEVSRRLFGVHGLMHGEFYEEPGNRRLRQVRLDTIGKTPEEVWIEVSVKMREIYAPVWADQGMARVHDDGRLYLFSDVRSLIEAQVIRDAGGLLVKITRPGQRVLALDTLIPEDFNWDAVLVNDGTQEQLEDAAVRLATSYLKGKR